MPSIKVYADSSSDIDFSITSTWTTGASSASVGSKTVTYAFPEIPSGALNIVTTVYATYDPDSAKGKTASGYPTANGVSFTNVSGDLYSAVITFSDLESSTKVTYRHKAGYTSSGTQGALAFSDVYILLEYDLPNADWTLDATTITMDGDTGGVVTGTLEITDDNLEYTHYLYVQYSGDTSEEPPYVLISRSSAQTVSFSITLPAWWTSSVASYTSGATAYVYYRMLDSSGSIIAEADPVLITLTVGGTVAPEAGTLYISVTDPFNGYTVQNYSSLTAT